MGLTSSSARLRDITACRVAVEVGATARTARAERVGARKFYLDAELPAFAMSAREAISLGSDFVRTGPVYGECSPGSFCDRFSPIGETIEGTGHPLQEASAVELRRLPPIALPHMVQVPDITGGLVVADALIYGVLELCFAVRGGWKFLEDCAEGKVEADLLLDWAADSLCNAYAAILSCASVPISLVAYRDDFGTPIGSYFSRADHDQIVMPRIKRVFDAIRAETDAPIAAFVSGAAIDLLPSLGAAGCTVIGIDPHARGMIAADIRRRVGSEIVLHKTIDLLALGKTVMSNDVKGAALLACELAAAMPVIAAPAHPVATADFKILSRASAFIATLGDDDLRTFADLGAERSILERAMGAPVSEHMVAEPLVLSINDLRSEQRPQTRVPTHRNDNADTTQ